MKTLLRTTLPLLLAVVLTACSTGGPGSSPTPSGPASATSAPPAPAAPRVATCHALTLDEATSATDDSQPVPCRQPHTAVTFKVGRLDDLADGHLLAVDSPRVRDRLASTCSRALDGFLGGDQTSQRLSRFEAVWFGPSVQQADAGADWYRCDAVGLLREGQLVRLPRRLKGVLGDAASLDRFGTCGSAAPSTAGFQRVACSEPHAWRAVSTVDLPAATHYLAKSAAATGDASCKDVAASRANGALKYTWSFEWPTRAQWASGQRWGYCWVPEKG